MKNSFKQYSLFIGLLVWIVLSQTMKSQSISYTYKNVRIGGGGFVSGIVSHPSCKNLIYARTDVGGAYRWNQADSTWIPLNDDLNASEWSLQGIESIGVDPLDTNRVYLATGMYTNNWTSMNGAVFRSSDKGKTWKRTMLSFKNGGNEDGRGVGERLVVDPNKNNILFFGTRKNGLWISTDSAVTWNIVSSFPESSTTNNGVGISFVIFDKSGSVKGTATQKIYAGIARKDAANIYVSNDGGSTWQPVTGQDYSMMPNHAVLTSDGVLYITYGDGVGPNNVSSGKVMKYNSISNTWTNVTPPTGQGGFAGISNYPSDPKTIVVSTIDRWSPGDEIYLSTDGGTSWKGILRNGILSDAGFPWVKSTSVHWTADVEIDPFNPDRIMFVTGYGLWSSVNATNANQNNPVTWKFAVKGLEEMVPLDLVSPSKGAFLLSVIGDYDGFRHDNPDVSPKAGRFSPSIGTTTGIAVASNNPDFVVRTGTDGYYSLNGGTTWTRFATKPSGAKNGKVAISADGSTIVWSPEGASMSYSRNKGASWTACAGGVPSNLRVVADEVNSQKFYIYDRTTGKIYTSTDGGATFINSATITQWGGPVKAVPGKDGEVWVPIYNGVWRSTNSGATFTNLGTIEYAEHLGFGKAAAGKTFPSVYLMGRVNGISGLFRSDDQGATWNRINDDQHQFGGINVITGDARIFGRFYLATSGRGVIYGQPLYDCNHVMNGTANVDPCGVCSGGNTGVSPCLIDCHGDVNGTAILDSCGKCAGGNTGLTPVLDKTKCTTGVSNSFAGDDFQLVPNPFTTEMHLIVKYPLEYQVYSLAGKLAESGFCRNECFIGKGLDSGVYMLTLKNKDQVKSVKIIKQ